jgi:indolepyruvate ferredoxin oxidoreductase beta subunit
VKERSGEAVQNILIVGVGGQGVLLASEVLAAAALQSGFEAKKSEVHGMAQRGGVVSSHVRFGRLVFSPLIKRGDTDVILAFEEAEALRWSSFLRREGILIVNRQCISSPLVTLGLERYPENIASAHSSLGDRYIGVDAFPLAMEMGDPRLVNTIMLGALSQLLPIPLASWKRTLRKKLPERLRDLNQRAFEKGRQLMAEARGKGFRGPRAARSSSARMAPKEG